MRAKSSVFWPNINNEIENVVVSCRICQFNAANNQKEPLIPHELPDKPFQKIACDILEHKGVSYLVAIDFFSKWIELVRLKNKQGSTLNLELLKIFASHGYPRVIIGDNMPLGSFECIEHARKIDAKIITSSPHYAQSNGLAERSVQICKNILKKSENEEAVLKALLAYRTTPIKDMKYSPAQLLQSRNLRTELPMRESKFRPELCVNVNKQLENKQNNMRAYYDRNAKQRPPFVLNQGVLFINNHKWQLGKIIEICDTPRSYIIESEGRTYRRNSKHIRRFTEKEAEPSQSNYSADSHHSTQSQTLRKVTRSGRTY